MILTWQRDTGVRCFCQDEVCSATRFMKPGIPSGDHVRQIAGGIEKMSLDAVVHTKPKRRPLTTAHGTKNEGNPEPAHKTGMPKDAEGEVLDEIELFLPMSLASRAVSAPLPQQIIDLQNWCLLLQFG